MLCEKSPLTKRQNKTKATGPNEKIFYNNSACLAVADAELNLGGGGSRGPKGRVGRVGEGCPLPLVGVRGPPPRKFLKKMMQNDAIWGAT